MRDSLLDERRDFQAHSGRLRSLLAIPPLPVAAAETVSGLAWGTTYHYRVVATNHSGTTYSADATFKTPDLRVSVLGVHPAVFAAESGGMVVMLGAFTVCCQP